MKLWLISQKVNNTWDTFDSAVVAAKTEDEARHIHPRGLIVISKLESNWCKPEDVRVEYIGSTKRKFPNTVICASFNAG